MDRRELQNYEEMLGNRKIYEMTEEEKEDRISREMGELCRHRLEKRWYRRLVIINTIMIIFVVSIFAANLSENMKLAGRYLDQRSSEFRKDINNEQKNLQLETEKKSKKDSEKETEEKKDSKKKGETEAKKKNSKKSKETDAETEKKSQKSSKKKKEAEAQTETKKKEAEAQTETKKKKKSNKNSQNTTQEETVAETEKSTKKKTSENEKVKETETETSKAASVHAKDVIEPTVLQSQKLTKDDIPFEVHWFYYGLSILIMGYLGLFAYYANKRAQSLRITRRNFPEVYQIIEDYADKLMIDVPKAYVMQSSGVLNAFSAFLPRRQWIMINSELFEVAYREYRDMDVLKFIIAHEMAHIYYGHATLHYNLPIWFSMRLPIIGAIASRTREYSCDRLAQRLTATSGIDCMLVLVVDRHLYKYVDQEDFIHEMKNVDGLFVKLANLVMDHPIMCKRVMALDDGKGSGELY